MIPWASWHIACRERLILVSGIGSLWEPGGTLCPRCVSLKSTLLHSEISHWKAKGTCASLCVLRTCFVCWWDEDGHVGSHVGDSPGVFTHSILDIIGVCSDVIIWSLCLTYMAGCCDTEAGGSDVVKKDSDGIAMTTSYAHGAVILSPMIGYMFWRRGRGL